MAKTAAEQVTWQDELVASLAEMKRWLRILALPALRQILEAEIPSQELRRIYQATDGRQIREVAAAASSSFGTVQRYWQIWAGRGLVEPTTRKRRFRRIVDLREVGLPVSAGSTGSGKTGKRGRGKRSKASES